MSAVERKRHDFGKSDALAFPHRSHARAGAHSGWRLASHSAPRSDGGRAIVLEATAQDGSMQFVLTAGEAAELMFNIGHSLEQAARSDPPPLFVGRDPAHPASLL